MKLFVFLSIVILAFSTIHAQDLASTGAVLNQLLLKQEVYHTQVIFPDNPYTIGFDVPGSYYKQLDVRSVSIFVRKAPNNPLISHLFEVYITCKGENNPCILVDIGEQNYLDIHAHLLFEKEEDAQKASELLLTLQKKVVEW